MAVFTEQMEKLTNELRASTEARTAFVHHTQEQTHQLLTDLDKEHQAMAGQQREALATHRQKVSTAAAALRDQTREHMSEMRKGLQEMLTQNCQQRQQAVAELRTQFHEAQAAVVGDLRQASVVWRQLFHAPAAPHVKKHRKAHTH